MILVTFMIYYDCSAETLNLLCALDKSLNHSDSCHPELTRRVSYTKLITHASFVLPARTVPGKSKYQQIIGNGSGCSNKDDLDNYVPPRERRNLF